MTSDCVGNKTFVSQPERAELQAGPDLPRFLSSTIILKDMVTLCKDGQ